MSRAVPESSSGIQVISRAAQVLRALRESPGGLTPSELTARLGLPRTTVHRIVNALECEELIAAGQGPRGRHRLGPEIARLAAAGTRGIVGLLHPYLVELSGQLTETVDLSVRDGSQVTFLDQVDAPHRLRAASAIGQSFPLHSCAPGKALLAALPLSRVVALLPERLPAMTAHTITRFEELSEQLEQIGATGVAYDYEEQNDGICAAGIAIDVLGQLLAISVPIPAQRFAGREQEIATALVGFRTRVRSQEWA